MGVKSIVLVASVLILTACGGGGSGGGDGDGGITQTVSGTVATGAALEGVVNVYGSNGGSVVNVPIDAFGKYLANVTGLTAPFFLYAIPTNSSLVPQYSWSNGAGTANITQMTTLALFYANGERDPATLVNAWPGNSAGVSANLPDAQAMVNANFDGVFARINSALNIDFTRYDFFSTGFNIGDTLDQILDLLSVDLSSSTPIVVDGKTFSFNPAIDITGINIGDSDANAGGTGGAVSALTISGASGVPSVFAGKSAASGIGGSSGFLQMIWIDNGLPQWLLSASIADDYIGTFGAVVTFGDYKCESGMFGLYGDCNGASFNHDTRTVTFSNVKLQASGFGAVITLNGTLKY